MNRRETGARYEDLAAAFLTQKGFQVVERNYRCRCGEVDLVARERVPMPDGAVADYLVFIEVKYRASGTKAGGPLMAVDRKKQERMIRTAGVYLKHRCLGEDTPVRFDVVGITPEGIEHVRDAFWV